MMDIQALVSVIISVAITILCIVLVMQQWRQYKQTADHLERYQRLGRRWAEEQKKEHEEAQADQVQSQ